MKILKIRFENIHSLKGRHEIDFAHGILGQAGLFAITGPTGSGKSTLLDVITLALYDNVARIGKMSGSAVEDDGGILTRNMKSCFAEVEYSSRGKVYRSHWSVERNRNNNLNPRKLELVAADTGEILASGISDTPRMNAEIIGLSYEQFVKAMVLSQGEFSKLLQAPRNERSKLLEDITGARSYREIGKAVYARHKKVEREIDLKKAGLETISLLTPAETGDFKKELKTLQETKPKAEKAFKQAEENLQTRKDLNKAKVEEEKLQKEREQWQQDHKAFEPFQKELDTHDRLSKYAGLLQDFDHIKKKLEDAAQEIIALNSSQIDSEEKQQELLKNISALIGETATPQSASEQLETFRDKVTALMAIEERKKEEANLYQKQLATNVSNISRLGYPLPKIERPTLFRSQIAFLQSKLDQTKQAAGADNPQQLEDRLKQEREREQMAGEFILHKEQWEKLESQLKNLLSQYTTLEEEVNSDTKKTETARTDLGRLQQEVTSLESQLEQKRQHQSLEEIRHNLQDGQPCPLCGSQHHPYADSEPHFNAEESMLREKRETLKTKSDLIAALSAKIKLNNERGSHLQKETEDLKEEIEAKKQQLEQSNQQLQWPPETPIAQLREKRKALSAQIELLEKAKLAFQAAALVTDLNKNLSHWEEALTAFEDATAKRSQLYGDKDINARTASLAAAFNSSMARLGSLNDQLKQAHKRMANLSKEEKDKWEELEGVLLLEDVPSIKALRTAILPQERATRIRNRERELKEQQVRLAEKSSALQKTVLELQSKDMDGTTMEQLEEVRHRTRQYWDELLKNEGRISNILETDRTNRSRHKELLDQLELLKKDLALWKTMNDLIGDSLGNKFSNFVQDLTLEQLIGFANKRLLEFSDRYQLDIPTPEESDRSDTLKVLDAYMGNARRSVRTLSGGETFLVSLALAFALSDIAARNVSIESLFIDEGFGTLDPDTLDQAITILEKMQSEGDRSVGVISHVSALKERITTQIKLRKGSLGYSTLEVGEMT